MALTVENANLVFEKARIAADSLGLNSGMRDALRALKAYLSQVKRNPDLAFVAISDLTVDVVGVDAPCKLYGVFLKKQATATDSFYIAFDDAANDATAGDARLAIGLVTSGDQKAYVDPKGLDLAAGFVHGAYTALAGANGTTASTTGDGPNGFAIVGAP